MGTYAVINNGTVINVIVWDGKATWAPPAGATTAEVPDGTPVQEGWTYNGTNFAAPASAQS